MRYVLEHLGYLVDALVSRVVWMTAEGLDGKVGSWYASTHPESNFLTELTAALVTDDARLNLRGRNLAIHTRGGDTERIRLDTATQVLDTLTNRFGINLSGLGDVESRVAAVLDN